MFKPTPKQQKLIDTFKMGRDHGVFMANATGDHYSGRKLAINGEEITSFASCSYLGLELDERLIEGSVDATRRYGTLFSTSRSYLQMDLYNELEAQLEKVFDAPCIVGVSTTLSHLSVFPALVTKEDAVIIDLQAHNSLQEAVAALVGKGTYREVVAHNDMVQLRERIEKLSATYEKVWYVADGIYSIYGDPAPFDKIIELLNEFPKLAAYVDDAHGMGWAGKHGRGAAPEALGHHERLILVTSLGKAFGTGGGVMVFPDENTRDIVRFTGKSLMFGMPLSPGVLGAALAATKILLSDELPVIQEELNQRCLQFLEEALVADLKIVDRTLNPIFYVGIGDYEILAEIVFSLQKIHKIFVTPTGYPAVPKGQSGLRITLTRLHTKEDITKLVQAISMEYDAALLRRGKSREEFSSQFSNLV